MLRNSSWRITFDSSIKQNGYGNHLKHGVKRAFDTTLLFIENNIAQFAK